MRDTSSWRSKKDLSKDLRAAWRDTGKGDFGVRDLLDVELGLYLLEQVAPGQQPDAVWTLLDGYPIPQAAGFDLDTRQHQMIRVGREMLSSRRNPYGWRKAISDYGKVPEHLRGFLIRPDGLGFQRRSLRVAPYRFEVFEQTLTALPKFQTAAVKPAGAGPYLVSAGRGRSGVTIPAWLPMIDPAAGHDLGSVRKREPLTVTREQLLGTARWAEQAEKSAGIASGDWLERLEHVEFVPVADGRLVPQDPDDLSPMVIDGMFHLLGMVGAGKSTLMDLLCMQAAKEKKRITVVVGDVTSLLRKVAYFNALGLNAAPVVGQSNRPRHVERLHRVVSHGDSRLTAMGDPVDQSMFDMVSTACPLDGLRDHDKDPWDLRRPPCRKLERLDGGDDDDIHSLHGCPLWHGCPRHSATRALVDADIWVTTIASLVYSEVPMELNREKVRYLEAAWRRSDLIVVDEADLVQAQLDAMFSPGQTLIGQGDAWLHEVVEQTNTQLKHSGRAVHGSRAVRMWLSTANNAKTAVDLMYSLLRLDRDRKPKVLLGWIDEDYFTDWTLSQQLAQSWAGFTIGRGNRVSPGWEDDPIYKHLRAAFDAFLDEPLATDQLTGIAANLSALTSEILRIVDEDARLARVHAWLEDLLANTEVEGRALAITDIRQQAVRLEFTLAVAVLADQLQTLLVLWKEAEAALGMAGANPLVLHRPPRDLQPVVPSTPMGGILGFQYRRDDEESADSRMGELRFFRCEGVGRWALTHLHDLFSQDGDDPVNVVLMSGTSWAGSSPRYHVDVPVAGVLQPGSKQIDNISKSTFEFLPLYARAGDADPITVSGHYGPRRAEMLAKMVQVLASPRDGGRSLLERHRDDLPAGRQRVLLLTGSYEEARSVAKALAAVRPSWDDQIRYMIPDDAEFSHTWGGPAPVRRSDVHGFGRSNAWILIAPLLAIERGHNILNDENVAAIGAAYFLIRPHPRPDDLTYVTQRLNQWALHQIKNGLPAVPHEKRASLFDCGKDLRHAGHRRWRGLLHQRLAYSSLGDQERPALIWSQLVSIWQVIGRLVRGGQPARVYFCDGAFAPTTGQRENDDRDVVATSLLLGLRHVLEPYFIEDSTEPDRELVQTLYRPLFEALRRIKGMG